ncbi:MAG: response regulator FixJ [Rhodopila sp.]|nr:response regulator FixJ [Rhodopila sp.]
MGLANTVYVVDDDSAVRDSLRMLLESSGFTVRTHDSARAFLAERPAVSGCVLTDVRMPEIDGLELQRLLREQGIWLPVIVMTGQGDIAIAVRAMKTGAVDFLEKPFDDEALFQAIDRALAENRLRREAASLSAEASARISSLTPREREVLDLLVTGLPNKAIGNELGTSPRTIEVHRARVMEKLQVRSLPELVRLVLATEAGAPGRI